VEGKKEMSIKKPHILFVEDEPHIRDLVKLLLAKLCHWQITDVPCGMLAINAWNKGNYDLIIMDIKLPRMGGIEAAKKIRELEIKFGRKRIPIIAYTAVATNKCSQDCLDAGMDYFITKPTQMNSLVAIIKEHLPEFFS
jgi:CheY-like chemotaxis protein